MATIQKPSLDELQKIFKGKSQCAPCMLHPKECKGDPKKAKQWKCQEFYSGFFIGRISKRK